MHAHYQFQMSEVKYFAEWNTLHENPTFVSCREAHTHKKSKHYLQKHTNIWSPLAGGLSVVMTQSAGCSLFMNTVLKCHWAPWVSLWNETDKIIGPNRIQRAGSVRLSPGPFSLFFFFWFSFYYFFSVSLEFAFARHVEVAS